MKEAILGSLKLRFASELIQHQSLILLTLVVFWMGARWEALKDRYSSSNMGLTLFFAIFGFAAIVSGIFAYEWGSEYVLMAITLGLGIGLAMSDAALSVCFFVALLFLRPWEVKADSDRYFALLPKLTMAFCIGNLILRWARQGGPKFHWNRTTSWLFAFAGWALLTTLKGGPEHQAVFFDNFFKCVFLFLIVLNTINTRDEINAVTWTIIITMFGVGLVSIYRTNITSAALLGIASQKIRLIGLGAFENSNDIAALMVMVFPFALVPLLKKGTPLFGRLFCLAMVGIVIECVRLSQSRGALLGLVAIVGAIILGTMKNRKHAIIIAAISAACVLAVGAISGRSEEDLTESQEIRVTYIETGLLMGLKNPILGVGFDGYASNFALYQTAAVDGAEHRTAHNSWVLAFAETGLIGLAFFVMVYFSTLKSAFLFRKTSPEFFLAILGYGIGMAFLSHTYFIYPYVLYALSGVAARILYVDKIAQN